MMKISKARASASLAVAISLLASCADISRARQEQPAGVSHATMREMVAQTVAPNLTLAEGVPPYDWAFRGRLHNGDKPPSGRTHINPWGVIFRAKGNPPSDDVAVEVGDLSLYVLYGGSWHRVSYNPRVRGELYDASFKWDAKGRQDTAPARYHTAPPKLVIADVDVPDWGYHFYLPKTAIRGRIDGIIVSFKARLVSKSGRDISDEVGTMLAQSGCDYKDRNSGRISDAFVSAMTPITTEFQRFYGTTMTVSELSANPPPRGLEQIW